MQRGIDLVLELHIGGLLARVSGFRLRVSEVSGRWSARMAKMCS